MTITVLTSNCVRISFDQLYKRIDGELCKVPPRANYNIMKVNKYDRQIRLWGQNGQRRLGEAKVALLGASGAGIEALKNLVLPGVGNIQVWAEGNVELLDLATCFFYAPEDVGRSKAEALIDNLVEMNPDDVIGKAFAQSPLDLVSDQSKLKGYSLLICADQKESVNKEVSQACCALNIPVVFITVAGFYVYVRNQQRLHFVESQNTSSKKYYMRLHDPFPSLKQYSSQWDIQKLVADLAPLQNKEERLPILDQIKYIPYPIVLLQAYNNLPKDKRSKQHILDKIKEWSLLIGEDHRESFSEAAGRTLDLYQSADNFLPDISIFENPHVAAANADSSPLLQFLRACGHFYKTNGGLPQPTQLPDMHTSTRIYLELKQVYRQEHELDIAHLQEILLQLTGANKLTNSQISDFIDNLASLQIIQFAEYRKELEHVENPNLPWEAPEWRNILLALRAYKIFEDREGRYPTPQDLEAVRSIAESIKKEYGFEEISDDRYLREVSRVEGRTTMSICSIGGAVASQEAIKLITRCFTPGKNGYLFSGVHSVGCSINI